MKQEFQAYASCLLQQGIDSQNAYEAAVDEFELDYNNLEVETWFNEIDDLFGALK